MLGILKVVSKPSLLLLTSLCFGLNLVLLLSQIVKEISGVLTNVYPNSTLSQGFDSHNYVDWEVPKRLWKYLLHRPSLVVVRVYTSFAVHMSFYCCGLSCYGFP